jgi:hypothetical protein
MPTDAAAVEATVLRHGVKRRDPGEPSARPTPRARCMPGPDWHVLMQPVRRAAIKLALGGRIVIYRKGRPADPNDFKGVYRLGLPRFD